MATVLMWKIHGFKLYGNRKKAHYKPASFL